jgi:hypothetical protein
MTKLPNLLSVFFNLNNIIVNGIDVLMHIDRNSFKYLFIERYRRSVYKVLYRSMFAVYKTDAYDETIHIHCNVSKS